MKHEIKVKHDKVNDLIKSFTEKGYTLVNRIAERRIDGYTTLIFDDSKQSDEKN